VIAAPDDSRKPIYALASVNQQIVANYFNWQAWPNFTDRGTAPRLGTYALQDLPPGRAVALQGTAMSVSAYPLRHDATESTAFLLESAGDAMLCLGDTGPDEVQQSTRLAELWTAVADKARRHQLKGIVIEVSYDSARADNKLFGHLTPKWLLHELRALDRLAGAGALRGMPVIVSHIKYALTTGQPQERIRAELDAGNDLGLRFILPEQGDTLRLP
jgi:3',5'-cyclic-nucleotide phosphodiesterase